MSRPTVIRGVIFPGLIAWEGRFARLLAEANGTTTTEIDTAIEAIAHGRALELAPTSTMTAWTWITLRNLSAYVRVRALYLRRCSVCDRWFQVNRANSRRCVRKACANKLAARRQAKWRRNDQQDNRDAYRDVRASVTRKGTQLRPRI